MARVNQTSTLNLTRIITSETGGKKITRAIIRDAKSNDEFMRDTLAELFKEKVAKKVENLIAGDAGRMYFGSLIWALSEYAVSLYQRAMPIYGSADGNAGVQIVTGSMATYMTSNVEAISYQIRAQGKFDASSMASASFSVQIPGSARRHEQAPGAEGMLASVKARIFNTGVPVSSYADDQKFAVLENLVSMSGDLHMRVRMLFTQLLKRFILPPEVLRAKKKMDVGGWIRAIQYVETLTFQNRMYMKANIVASLNARIVDAESRGNQEASGPRR